MSELHEILKLAKNKKASDIHLKTGLVPIVRRYGLILPLSKKWSPLSHDQMVNFTKIFIKTKDEMSRFNQFKEIDLSYGIKGMGRFRVNVFLQKGGLRIVIRIISDKIPKMEDLNLPDVIKEITHLERGLVLVTGVTGSGKSTTLASMVNRINQTKNKHIITIEDPIEYLIQDYRSMISQRELGFDTTTFSRAMRAALRQDPDVILVGEMRDKETIDTALIAGATGHLVFSTLHSSGAQETVNRILGVFESHQQDQVRRQLASTLKAIISQRLVSRKDKNGLVPVVEIMINNARIRELIEIPEKTKLISSVLDSSDKDTGMQSFDQSLLQLISKNIISLEDAFAVCDYPDDLYLKYKGIKPDLLNEEKQSINDNEHENPFEEESLPSFSSFDFELENKDEFEDEDI